MTLTIAIMSGLIGGYICSLNIFSPVHALFRDDDNVFDAVLCYPKSFLVDGDEQFNEVNRLVILLRSKVKLSIG